MLTSQSSIECALDAKVRTPIISRTDLLQHTNRPEVIKVSFVEKIDAHSPTALSALNDALQNYAFESDPYIMQLTRQNTSNARSQKELAIMRRKTRVYEQLRVLRNRSDEILKQFGSWACQWFIHQCFKTVEAMSAKIAVMQFDMVPQEQQHLVKVLRQVVISSETPAEYPKPLEMTSKMIVLIELLIELRQEDTFRGIIFVKQRASVAVMSAILAALPVTKTSFNIGTFVGASSYNAKRVSVTDLADLKGQALLLSDFRKGSVDLMISTNVLEEGIDVPACNVIVCFDPAENYISYVQRRGRARQSISKLYVFTHGSDSGITKFKDVEKELQEIFMQQNALTEDERQRQNEDHSRQRLRLSTGALLTAENAVPHLHHFCANMARQFVDSRPEFSYQQTEDRYLKRAIIELPLSVDASMRHHEGTQFWHSERAARRDAAFNACLKLHSAGLLNDHFLPKIEHVQVVQPSITPHSNLLQVEDQIDCNTILTDCWHNTNTIYSVSAEIDCPYGLEAVQIKFLWPLPVSKVSDIQLFWNEKEKLKVRLVRCESEPLNSSMIKLARRATRILLASTYRNRISSEDDDFTVLIMPNISWTDLEQWITQYGGPPYDIDKIPSDPQKWGLIRDTLCWHRPFVPTGIRKAVPTVHRKSPFAVAKDALVTCYKATAIPKRTDFLHPVLAAENKTLAYSKTYLVPLDDCTMDVLPLRFSVAMLFAPSIIATCEDYLIAQQFQQTKVNAKFAAADSSLLITALSHSAAHRSTDYQRLENLGDAILKFVISQMLMIAHPTWPEAYMSRLKSQLVSNDTLTKIAIDRDYAKYVITKSFTGKKWRPRYTSDSGGDSMAVENSRTMSSKIPADVVEALIAVSFLSGHHRSRKRTRSDTTTWDESGALESSYRFVLTLFPPISGEMSNDAGPRTFVKHAVGQLRADSSKTTHRQDLALAEQHLEYTFRHRSLLEDALTHSSHPAHAAGAENNTYERLEFFGDSLLDLLITQHLYFATDSVGKEVPHYRMHTLRTALVNADFLAFLCLEMQKEMKHKDVEPEADMAFSSQTISAAAKIKFSIHERTSVTTYVHLMQHDPNQFGLLDALSQAMELHNEYKEEIYQSLISGRRYPWTTLARTRAPKFVSDLIESAIGAIYIDSNGDLETCRTFLRRLGILQIAERLILDNVDCLHPKEKLGIVVGDHKVRYEAEEVVVVAAAGSDTQQETSSDSARPHLRIAIHVDDQCVCSVVGRLGEGKMLVETLAAETALSTAAQWLPQLPPRPRSAMEVSKGQVHDEVDDDNDDDE